MKLFSKGKKRIFASLKRALVVYTRTLNEQYGLISVRRRGACPNMFRLVEAWYSIGVLSSFPSSTH